MDRQRPRSRRTLGRAVITMLLVSLLTAWPAAGTPNEPEPKPNGAIPTPPRASGPTHAAQPGPTKNDLASQPATAPTPAAAGPMRRPASTNNGDVGTAATFRMQSCGSVQDGGFTTTSSSFVVIRSCTLDIPEAGFVFLSASSSVGLSSGDYELRTNVNIDAVTGNPATDRWINSYGDTGDGTDKTTATTLLAPVSAGAHTFYYLGARYSGTGTVQLYDPSLSVLYFPSSVADVLSCGVASNTTWTTTESSFQAVRSCSLLLPASGFVFLSANASAGLGAGGAYELRARVGVDTVTGTASADRWVNVYPDAGDGSDETLATSLLTSVAAGAHTFYFSATRYAGAGTVQLYDPTLSVLYFKAPNSTAMVCGAGGSDSWTSVTTSYSTIRSCSLPVPDATAVYVDAGASAGLNAAGAGNDWEGQFRVGVDNDSGTTLSDRWLNIYADASPGDGTDRSLVDTLLTNVTAGTHTFYLVGRRYSGTGTVRLYAPSLTVIVPLAEVPPTPTPTATPTGSPTPTSTPTPTTGPAAPPGGQSTIVLPFVQR